MATSISAPGGESGSLGGSLPKQEYSLRLIAIVASTVGAMVFALISLALYLYSRRRATSRTLRYSLNEPKASAPVFSNEAHKRWFCWPLPSRKMFKQEEHDSNSSSSQRGPELLQHICFLLSQRNDLQTSGDIPTSRTMPTNLEPHKEGHPLPNTKTRYDSGNCGIEQSSPQTPNPSRTSLTTVGETPSRSLSMESNKSSLSERFHRISRSIPSPSLDLPDEFRLEIPMSNTLPRRDNGKSPKPTHTRSCSSSVIVLPGRSASNSLSSRTPLHATASVLSRWRRVRDAGPDLTNRRSDLFDLLQSISDLAVDEEEYLREAKDDCELSPV
ncbi:predicted protein [Uncinocarpus reesii 1704]|uniref:Uncharacterized protein n=1 Tax=Uncinocarpus reesii (strain UAMH 1704) TaxID=336963 RepID=C4JEW2_UNCRE|nr:uncharacterized protein UREG_00862 [Uncinocarpus reesii 1704]EEP76015.1 predicted protein [Uncinocarpus reesii 1704]